MTGADPSDTARVAEPAVSALNDVTVGARPEGCDAAEVAAERRRRMCDERAPAEVVLPWVCVRTAVRRLDHELVLGGPGAPCAGGEGDRVRSRELRAG